jgi:CubicO group peptidase (beta-lactamase class C family)
MSDFDALLDHYTQRGNPLVHGAIIKCVDHKGTCHPHAAAFHSLIRPILGTEIYSKLAGYSSLAPDAPPVREDAILKLASATKFITSIALLQCVDKGLIGLDEPLTKILPEFKDKDILTHVNGPEYTFVKSKTAVTARHLLSHTSGLGYRFTHRLLMQRAQLRKDEPQTLKVPERYDMPLVFEPGTGWLYGCSLDWAGAVVSRLHHGISLEEYLVEHIWKPLGLSAPFPRFNIALHPEYNERLLQGAKLVNRKLEHQDVWAFDNPEGQDGGSGLSATATDFVAVLADLVSASPRLLKQSTIESMFIPQLVPKSSSMKDLLALRPVWDTVTGPISEDNVNHGLGGILCVGPVPEIGQPPGMLGWGGASNIIWWINRDEGVAGFFATQQSPFGNENVTNLVNAWKRDFWAQYKTLDNI